MNLELLDWFGCLTSARHWNPPASAIPALGLQAHVVVPSFSKVGAAVDPNSSTFACLVDTLLSEPHPLPHIMFKHNTNSLTNSSVLIGDLPVRCASAEEAQSLWD